MPATTYIGVRNRAIDPATAVAQQTSKALRPSRSYQRQHLTLTDGYVFGSAITVGSFTGNSQIAHLMPGDTVVSAVVAVVENGASTTYDVEINGTLRGANLGGTWSLVPNFINILPYAAPAVNSSVYSLQVRLKNVSGSTSALTFQVLVVVLR